MLLLLTLACASNRPAAPSQAVSLQLRDENKVLKEQSLQENSSIHEQEKLKFHIQEMERRISDHHSSMQSVQEDHERVREESRALQEQVDTLSSELSLKDREISSLKGELEAHLTQAGDPHTGESVTREEQNGLELAVVRRELEGAQLQNEALGARCSELESTLSQCRQANVSEVAMAQVKSDLDYYKQAFEGKEKELEGAIASHSRIMEEMAVLKGTLQGRQAAASDTERVVKSVQADKLALQNKVQSLEEAEGVRLGELQALQQQNAKYTKQLSNLKDHLIEVAFALSLEMLTLSDSFCRFRTSKQRKRLKLMEGKQP
jgi:chromosome segregation ATPase